MRDETTFLLVSLVCEELEAVRTDTASGTVNNNITPKDSGPHWMHLDVLRRTGSDAPDAKNGLSRIEC
jgi:hypothetical protein